ncbi:MAG: hypothetical protein IJO45_05390 [Oscillospiraceae bacterium]|nr:hypothetical protein [Oscillospiraceae bacterium]
MKNVSIFFPILWSLIASWNTYRVFTDLPRLRAQACWVTVVDILWLICGFALAISYWVMFVKKSKEQDKQGKDGNG